MSQQTINLDKKSSPNKKNDVTKDANLAKKKALEILTAKLYQLQEKKKEKELKQLQGGRISPEWGNQIRSYILHPYKLVKDHRTQKETNKVDEVLDGWLDEFIEEEIIKKV